MYEPGELCRISWDSTFPSIYKFHSARTFAIKNMFHIFCHICCRSIPKSMQGFV